MHEISLKRKTLRPNFKTNFFACAVCILICSPNDILLIRQIFIIALEYCILLKKIWTNSKKKRKKGWIKRISRKTQSFNCLYICTWPTYWFQWHKRSAKTLEMEIIQCIEFHLVATIKKWIQRIWKWFWIDIPFIWDDS